MVFMYGVDLWMCWYLCKRKFVVCVVGFWFCFFCVVGQWLVLLGLGCWVGFGVILEFVVYVQYVGVVLFDVFQWVVFVVGVGVVWFVGQVVVLQQQGEIVQGVVVVEGVVDLCVGYVFVDNVVQVVVVVEVVDFVDEV